MRLRAPGFPAGFILALLSLPLLGGCFSAALSSEDAARASRLVIVPVESPPAFVMGYEAGAGPLMVGGSIGLAIQEPATREARRKLAARLNELTRERLLDTATGRILAKAHLTDSAKPAPSDDAVSEARRLEAQYRTAAERLCTRMLGEMKMIVSETRR